MSGRYDFPKEVTYNSNLSSFNFISRSQMNNETTHDIPQATEDNHDRQDLRRPRRPEQFLEEQRSDKLSGTSDLLLLDRSDIRDVRQQEQHGDESQRDGAGVLDGADGVWAAHFGENIKRVVPAYICEMRFDERGGEGVAVVGTPSPRVGEVRERLRDAGEPEEDCEACCDDTIQIAYQSQWSANLKRGETGLTRLEKRLLLRLWRLRRAETIWWIALPLQ